MPSLKKLSKLLFNSALALILAFTIVPAGFLVVPALAAEVNDKACTCYCGNTRDGATNENVVADQGACSALCRNDGKQVVGCFQNESAFPENDNKCWTKDECSKFATDKFGNAAKGTWGGQSATCVKTHSKEDTGFCYAPDIPVNLNIPILGATKVSGFPEYLSLAYTFLLPAMSLIAVVMIMIGGLEYVVAGGSSKRVEKAKTRIKNAVIGLLLLLSAYTIASLLDPRLVKFGQLRVPLLKQAILLDPNTSCERLLDYGFELKTTTGMCGQDTTVESTDKVTAAAKNSVAFKKGEKCHFSTCGILGEACMNVGGRNECTLCVNINTLNARNGGVPPSGQTCSQAQVAADLNDKDPDHEYMCEIDYAGINTCVSAGTDPLGQFIDCAVVRSNAKTGDPCKAYEQVIIDHPTADLLTANSQPISEVKSADYGIAAKVCEGDPCGVSRFFGETCGFYVPAGVAAAADYIPIYGSIIDFLDITANQCLTVGGHVAGERDTSGPGTFATP